MSMQATKKGSRWISAPITQGGTENDWIEQQPIIEGSMGLITPRSGTNSTQLVCLAEEIANGERFVIRQDGVVYEGTADVIASKQIEESRTKAITLTGRVPRRKNSSGRQPSSIRVKTDGTVLYAIDSRSSNTYINTYPFSTSWDVYSIGTYTNHNITSVVGTRVDTFAFSNDGTKVFFAQGYNQATIKQCTLSTAWDITTLTYDSSIDVSAQLNVPANSIVFGGIDFNDTGTKMYLASAVNDPTNGYVVYQYTLSTAWDLSTATYDNVWIPLDPTEGSPTDITFALSGSRLYVSKSGNNMQHYNLSTPWDLSTATLHGASGRLRHDGSSFGNDIYNSYMKEDATKLYTITYRRSDGATIWEFSLPADDDVYYKQENTIDLTDFGLSTSPQYVFTQIPEMRVCLEDTGPRCVSRDTPMYLYAVGTDQLQVVHSDTLGQELTAGDFVYINEGDVEVTSVVDTGTTTPAPTIAHQGSSTLIMNSLYFSDDGLTAIGGDLPSPYIKQLVLTTPFDMSTASTSGILHLEELEYLRMRGVAFSGDGKWLFVSGEYSTIRETAMYRLHNPWDITGGAYCYKIEGNAKHSIEFSPDGLIMYSIEGSTGNTLRAYFLNSPYMYYSYSSTTTLYVRGFTDSNSNASSGISFSSDGKTLYHCADTTIDMYKLAVEWDITTAVLDSTFSVSGADPFSGIAVNDAGDSFIVVSNGGTYMQYNMQSQHSLGGAKIWNVNLPLSEAVTFVYIRDRSDLMPYSRLPVTGTVEQVNVSVSTTGSINHTFDSQSFEKTPKRAIQLSTIAGNNTTVTTLRANLWKAGTPTL